MSSTKETINRIRERLERDDVWGYQTLIEARLAIRDLIRLAYVLADEEREAAVRVCEEHLETFAYGESTRDAIKSIIGDIRRGIRVMDLEQALRAVITEARSQDGVGTSIYRALEIAERTRRQLAALDRIVAELRDDGISDEALTEAESTLI